jgi:hypothetical protein
MRLPLGWLVAATLLFSTSYAGCDLSPRQEGVYYEYFGPSGLAADRSHALRLTVWTWGTSVGGRVDFFPIDGTVNTRTQPFFEADGCSYFGVARLVDREFRLRAKSPSDDELLIQATWDPENRDRIRGIAVAPSLLLTDGAEVPAGGLALRFDIDADELPSFECAGQ